MSAGNLVDLRVPPPDDLFSLAAAAKRYGVDRKALRGAIDDGRVRSVKRQPTGAGVRILLSAAQLVEDVRSLPPCGAQDCQQPAWREHGYCSEHAFWAAVDAARSAASDVVDRRRDWYHATEAAEIAGVSLATIYKAINKGELPSEKVGRHRRIPKRALREWRKIPRRPGNRTSLEERTARRARVLELDRDGLTPVQIAKELGCSLSAVRSDLDRSGRDRPRRKRPVRRLDAAGRAERAQRSAELYVVDGLSERKVAAALDSSRTQVRRDLAKLDVEMRPGGRPAKYPPVAERPCERCGDAFLPECPAAGDQRYCGDLCAREARAAANQAVLTAAGLISPAQAAKQLDLSVPSVHRYLASSLLAGERVAYPGYPRLGWGVHESNLPQFERYLARAMRGGGRRAAMLCRWLDEDQAIKQLGPQRLERKAGKLGNEVPDQEDLQRARVIRRRKRVVNHGRGRKPTPGPPDHYHLWQGDYESLEHELLDAREENKNDNEHTGAQPTRMDVCAAIFEKDWLENPDRWPRDAWPPASTMFPDAPRSDLRRDGATKVWNGLKRLQKLLTENAGL
jgi:excisionase family DNA binding protein